MVSWTISSARRGYGDERCLRSGAIRRVHGGLEEHYAVIGGTACDVLLNAAELPFRATKDIDVVLMVEYRPAEVGRAIWRLVSDGGYAVARRGVDGAQIKIQIQSRRDDPSTASTNSATAGSGRIGYRTP